MGDIIARKVIRFADPAVLLQFFVVVFKLSDGFWVNGLIGFIVPRVLPLPIFIHISVEEFVSVVLVNEETILVVKVSVSSEVVHSPHVH